MRMQFFPLSFHVFCLLQSSGADYTESEVVSTARRVTAAATRRPAVARRAAPIPAPYNASSIIRSRKGIPGIRWVDVHLAAERPNIAHVPVVAPLPHVAMHVVKPPGIRQARTDNGSAMLRPAGIIRLQIRGTVQNLASVSLVAPLFGKVLIFIRI